jgi:GH35 family endo-1,4-beta-xylanase
VKTIFPCLLALALAPAIAAQDISFRAADAPLKPFLGDGNLYESGEVGDFFRVTGAGRFRVTVRVRPVPGKDGQPPVLALMIDKLPVDRRPLEGSDWQEAVFEASLTEAVHLVGVQMLHDTEGTRGAYDLELDTIAVEPLDGAALERADFQAWFAGAQARENAVLAAADARIREHRMGRASVVVRDAKGNVVSGARVSAELTRHAFLFGANICRWEQFPDDTRNRAYKHRFGELFNYATLPFYWRLYEPARGRKLYGQTEAVAAWCKQRGIEMKGHTLLWTNEAGIPAWAGEALPAADVQEQHVREVLKRFAGDIRWWEVVNEPVNQGGVAIGPPHRWARETAPDARLVINEYGIFYEGHPDFHAYLAGTIAEGVPFDAIGIQAHAPVNMAFPLDRVWVILDGYALLGKPIHITEFTPASNGRNVLGSPWRGAWTEETQAAYAEDFYRACFAHPAVEAISWWDFSDQGAWLPGGGLLREDCTAKPAYDRLMKLIHETWRTRAEGESGADGEFAFDGFHGSYAIRVSHSGREQRLDAVLEKAGDNRFEVVLSGS